MLMSSDPMSIDVHDAVLEVRAVDPRERCKACRSTCPTTRKKRRGECEAKEVEHVDLSKRCKAAVRERTPMK